MITIFPHICRLAIADNASHLLPACSRLQKRWRHAAPLLVLSYKRLVRGADFSQEQSVPVGAPLLSYASIRATRYPIMMFGLPM